LNCNCPETPRMSCRYTVPLGNRSRYRNYRCPKCGRWERTVELAYDIYLDISKLSTVVEAVEKAERLKTSFLKRMKPKP
jgi:hypothetical protein